MRIPQLDYLRGVAVLLVIGRHLDPIPKDFGWAIGPLVIWEQCGWVGVDLFFVLSGFLVSGLIMAEYRSTGRVRISRFLVRRGFKIYPAFYVMLTATALLTVARGHSIPVYPFWCEVFYVQNYGGALWQHTWTLAVEEHFYLALGLSSILFVRFKALRRPTMVICGFLAGMIFCLAARIVTWRIGVRDPGSYGATHLRFDAFLAGALLSYLNQFHREVVYRWVDSRRILITLAGLALVSPCLIFDVSLPAILTAGFTALYLGFALILIAAVGGTSQISPASPKGHASAALAFIGLHSYSIYLWHIPIRRWVPPAVDRLVGGPLLGPLELAIYLVGSVVIGYVMARLVEVPFLKIRDRFFPPAISRREVVAPAPATPTPDRLPDAAHIGPGDEALTELQTKAEAPLPDVVVSVINHSNPALLAACLRSLYATTRSVSIEVWVVDNATDGLGVAEMRAEFPAIHWLFNDHRLGFSANHNQVLVRAIGRYYCVLNDDTIIHDRSLDRLVSYLDTQPDVGVAGPRLLNPDRSVQRSTFRFPDATTELAGICYLPRRLHFLKDRGYDPAHFGDEPANVDWVLGACLLIRAEALRTVGLLDDILSPLANTEEVDWCRRAWKAGWKVVFCPIARVTHYGGQSLRAPVRGVNRIRVEMMRTRLAYFAKHDGRVTATLIAVIYVCTLPWNGLVLFQSCIRRRTLITAAWDELTTLGEIAATGLKYVRNLATARRSDHDHHQ